MTKDTLKGLLTAFFILSLLALIFEAYLWQRQIREHARLEERYADRELCMRAAHDARLVYELKPGQCGTNSQGFLDDERSFEKSSEVFRIVLIGDSVAAGQGVRRDERFGERLSSLLSNAAGHPVEIVNLALGGYSTDQELIVLERWGMRYEPDLILWSYVLNDPAHPIFHDANGEAGRYFNRPSWRGYHYFERKIFEVRERWRARKCPIEFHALLHCAYKTEIEENLRKLAATAGSTSVVFTVTPVLIESDSFSDYPYRGIHEELVSMAAALGFDTVDLLDAFAATNPQTLSQDLTPWFDPWHPNAAGHDLFATYLADHIAPKLSASFY